MEHCPTERLYRMREYERQMAVQRLQDDDARTTALQDFKAKMLEERKAFRRQNDMERYRVIQSMEKMRKNPAKAVQGDSPPVSCILFTPNAFSYGAVRQLVAFGHHGARRLMHVPLHFRLLTCLLS